MIGLGGCDDEISSVHIFIYGELDLRRPARTLGDLKDDVSVTNFT